MNVSAVTFASLAVAALVAGAAPAADHAHDSTCPHGALPLGANPLAPATRAAVARESKASRPQAVEAVIATGDLRGRGGQVKHECGARAAARTVVVSITLRALLPSASLSERVSFVSSFRGRWRAW